MATEYVQQLPEILPAGESAGARSEAAAQDPQDFRKVRGGRLESGKDYFIQSKRAPQSIAVKRQKCLSLADNEPGVRPPQWFVAG